MSSQLAPAQVTIDTRHEPQEDPWLGALLVGENLSLSSLPNRNIFGVGFIGQFEFDAEITRKYTDIVGRLYRDLHL